MVTISCLVSKFFKKIFFWIQRLKEMYTGFEQLEGEKLMIEFSSLDELSHVQRWVAMKSISSVTFTRVHFWKNCTFKLKKGIFTLTRVHF